MRVLVRVLGRVAGTLLALVLLAVCGVGGALWLTLPPARDALRVEGLSAAVEVTFDQDGVPRIRAADWNDAATALGYLHARDRMFQMELMRRNASGRLSEIAGPATLRLDELNRVLGLRARAEADLGGLPPETQSVLAAYARGVNAWIAARGRFAAAETLFLGAPEPWTPVDSLLWGKTMSLWLSYNYRTELARAALAGHLAPARIDELWPRDGEAGHPDAALDPPRHAALPRAAGSLATLLPAFPAPFTRPDTASNEWAVDGRHTASGAPLLAGDPHLELGFPGIWYLARIDLPGATLAGATAPGVPFLVLGHNGHIAWTFTTTGADTQDLFRETALPDGRYATPDGPAAYATRDERIRVRGQPDRVLTVRETRHGPVLSDLGGPAAAPPGEVLALASASLAPGDQAAAGLYDLDRAGSVAAAARAAAEITAPVQNLLVADRAGIALYTTGRVPLRRAGDGYAPVAGADGAHDWVGLAGGERLPRIVAPPSGRLVNGNERVAPPDFPVLISRDAFGDWRARRIRQMLEGHDRLTVADFTHMQIDDEDLFAREVLPALLAAAPAEGLAGRAASLLRRWDGRMDADLPQPLILNAWVQRFYALVLARNGAEAWNGPWNLFTAWVLGPRGAPWCGGDCGPLLRAALADAVGDLARRYGGEPASWRWRDAHQAVFAHPVLAPLPLLGPLTTARVPVPGDDNTVFRGGATPGDLASRHGPAYRGVYDLADLDASRFIAAPGQSGNPLSPTARVFLDRWSRGDTIALGPAAERVTATLRLTP